MLGPRNSVTDASARQNSLGTLHPRHPTPTMRAMHGAPAWWPKVLALLPDLPPGDWAPWAAALTEGQEAWPDVRLEPEVFAVFLAERAVRRTEAVDLLADLRLADLWLCCAALH